MDLRRVDTGLNESFLKLRNGAKLEDLRHADGLVTNGYGIKGSPAEPGLQQLNKEQCSC